MITIASSIHKCYLIVSDHMNPVRVAYTKSCAGTTMCVSIDEMKTIRSIIISNEYHMGNLERFQANISRSLFFSHSVLFTVPEFARCKQYSFFHASLLKYLMYANKFSETKQTSAVALNGNFLSIIPL